MKKTLLIATVLLFAFGSFAVALDLNMDAEPDEFYGTLTGPEDGYLYFDHTDCGTPDQCGIIDDIDLSAFAWFAWDSTYFYGYFEITDDIILVNNTTAYENDAVEYKIDPDPYAIDETATGVAAYRVSAWSAEEAEVPEAVQNIDSGEAGEWPHEIVEGEDYARKEVFTDDRYGYNLEFRVPFETMVVGDDRFIIPGVGVEFGLAINIMDNDESGRESVLRWASNMDDLVWNEPARHGTVTLLEGNKVKLSTMNAITGVDTNSNDYTPPATLVESLAGQTPVEFNLEQNYPNPFNPSTNIQFSLPSTANVSLDVYNLLGEKVSSLVNNQVMQAGVHNVTFDASEFNSGVYLYRLQAGDNVEMKKMMFIK